MEPETINLIINKIDDLKEDFRRFVDNDFAELKDEVKKINGRVGKLEQDKEKRQHLWATAGKVLAALVGVGSLLTIVLKFFNVF